MQNKGLHVILAKDELSLMYHATSLESKRRGKIFCNKPFIIANVDDLKLRRALTVWHPAESVYSTLLEIEPRR